VLKQQHKDAQEKILQVQLFIRLKSEKCDSNDVSITTKKIKFKHSLRSWNNFLMMVQKKSTVGVASISGQMRVP
jgi:hypothetical protein